MAIITNKGNAEERTVGTLQKLTLTIADIQGMTSGTAATSWTNTGTGSPYGSAPSTVSLPYSAGDQLMEAFGQVETQLTGGSNTAVGLAVGYKGTSNTSANAFVTSTEVLSSSYVKYFCGAGSSNGAGYAALESGNISVTLTATGDTLANLTAGQISIYIYQKFATDVYA